MSTQYGNQGGTGAGTSGTATGTMGTSGAANSSSSAGGDTDASSLNWGSARSDYGDQAYGGSLDAQGLGGASYDDFNEGRRDAGSRGESSSASMRTAKGRTGGARRSRGYGLADTGSTGLTLLAGMVIGAGLMYLFDPEQGGRRRALLRDQLVGLSSDAAGVLGKTARDLRNRAQGVIAETTKSIGLGGGGSQGESNTGGNGGQMAGATTVGGA